MRACNISGKKTLVGNYISHADIRTLRKFKVNLHWKNITLEEQYATYLGMKKIKLRISCYGLRLCKYYGSLTNLLRSTSKRLRLSEKLKIIRKRLIKKFGLFNRKDHQASL